MDDTEFETDRELESICQSVEGRSIASYIPIGTKLNGKVLEHAGESYGDRGDGLEHNPSTWNSKCEGRTLFSKLCEEVRSLASNHNGNVDAMAFTFWDEMDPNKSDKVILSVFGSQDMGTDTGSMRGFIPYNLYAEMPREQATRLLEMIRSKPKIAEKFYQKTFKDLDSQPDKDTGLRRLKTDNIKIIDLSHVKSAIERDGYLTSSSALNIWNDSESSFKLPEKVGVRESKSTG